MKTITFTIATVLTLQAAVLFAGNESTTTSMTTESVLITLAPSVPVVATFEDFEVPALDIAYFAPAMPLEADFTDVAPETDILVMNLAPVTPVAADFNDTVEAAVDIRALSPVTPLTADFE